MDIFFGKIERSYTGRSGGMVDTQRSERCGRKLVEVRLLSSAPSSESAGNYSIESSKRLEI